MTQIRVKFNPARELADRLDRTAASGRLALNAAQAVNDVTVAFNDSQIAEQTRTINLTQAYVRSKTDVTLARPLGKPRAEILTRGDLTVLGNFTPLAMTAGRGVLRRAGPRIGMRNAGTRVSIKRASPVFEPQWFVLPLRRGRVPGGNGFGVFVRDDSIPPSKRALREGRHGKRHIYGPSPYSMFRRQIDTRSPEVQARLAERALALMGDGLRQEIGR